MHGLVKTLLMAATLAVAFAAPNTDFGIPVIGHVYDAASGEVRSMTGAPGAATIATGVAIGDFRQVLLPGDASFALVSSPANPALQLLRFGTSGSEASAIENVPAEFDRGVLSPSGMSALLYSAACDCVHVVSGLRTTPALLRTISLPPGSELRGLAVDDRATVTAIALEKILLYTGESATPLVELALTADALSFDAAGQRLLTIGKAARTVHLISNLGESPVVTELLSERDGLSTPSAAAFAPNGVVLIADVESGVIVWNESARTAQVVACLCQPSLLERAADSGLYRISSLEHGAVWMFDATAETPRTFFVPAPRAQESK